MTEMDDIPGTFVFNGHAARRGYRLNKMLMSFRDPAARQRFLADESGYCDEFGLTDAQRDAVLDRDWQSLCEEGGSIFYVFKLAMVDGKSMQHLGGAFTGMTEQEFVAMMRAGGRTGG
jgi:protocatechuate 4,5-dioxygenase alpha chain